MRPTFEDDDFVHHVNVQEVIEGPRAIVSIQGRIRTRVVRLDRHGSESRNEVLNVTRALHVSDGRAM